MSTLNPYGLVEMLDTAMSMWNGSPLFQDSRCLIRGQESLSQEPLAAVDTMPIDKSFSGYNDHEQEFRFELLSDSDLSIFTPISPDDTRQNRSDFVLPPAIYCVLPFAAVC